MGRGGTNATSIGCASSVAYSTGTAAFSAAGTSGQCRPAAAPGAQPDHLYRCGQRQHTQTAYANSPGGTTPEIAGANTRTTVDIQAYGQTADLQTCAYSAAGLGSPVWRLSNTGAVSMAGSADRLQRRCGLSQEHHHFWHPNWPDWCNQRWHGSVYRWSSHRCCLKQQR